jgi:hypothetical protein
MPRHEVLLEQEFLRVSEIPREAERVVGHSILLNSRVKCRLALRPRNLGRESLSLPTLLPVSLRCRKSHIDPAIRVSNMYGTGVVNLDCEEAELLEFAGRQPGKIQSPPSNRLIHIRIRP